MYSFDTSVLMDWLARYYPPDIFISLVIKIEDLIVAGHRRLLRPGGIHKKVGHSKCTQKALCLLDSRLEEEPTNIDS